MKHILRPSIIAHKIRIYQYEDTQSFSGSSVCLRAEFYGCDFYSGKQCNRLKSRVHVNIYYYYLFRFFTRHHMPYMRGQIEI